MNNILHVENLNKQFGAVVAASNINVSVSAGEVVAIIGANGAGKTTFVNMVTGYMAPSSGSIHFMGKNVSGRSPREVCKAGLSRSFQVAQLFPSLTVLENMMVAAASLQLGPSSFFAPLASRAARNKALQVLDSFGVSQFADSPANVLAQGVRKLLDISMALVSGPSMLLLDEPTSGVAVDEKFPLMESVMNGVKHTGATVMFVEHDMEIVSHYATRVIAFYQGEIIADGSVKQVLADERVQQYIVGRVQETALHGAAND